jgi:hypothetical protein
MMRELPSIAIDRGFAPAAAVLADPYLVWKGTIMHFAVKVDRLSPVRSKTVRIRNILSASGISDIPLLQNDLKQHWSA